MIGGNVDSDELRNVAALHVGALEDLLVVGVDAECEASLGLVVGMRRHMAGDALVRAVHRTDHEPLPDWRDHILAAAELLLALHVHRALLDALGDLGLLRRARLRIIGRCDARHALAAMLGHADGKREPSVSHAERTRADFDAQGSELVGLVVVPALADVGEKRRDIVGRAELGDLTPLHHDRKRLLLALKMYREFEYALVGRALVIAVAIIAHRLDGYGAVADFRIGRIDLGRDPVARVCALFVSAGRAVVLVGRKLASLRVARPDVERHSRLVEIGRGQRLVIHRNDRSAPDKYWNLRKVDRIGLEPAAVRSGGFDLDAAAVVVVVPRAMRNVDALSPPTLVDAGRRIDGSYENIVAHHELILRLLVPRHGIVGIVPDHRTDDGRGRKKRLAHERIEIRSRADLLLERLADMRLVRLGIAPRALVHVAPAVHHINRRRPRLPLQIAQIRFVRSSEDAVDIRGGVRLARHRRAGDRRDHVADEIPAAVLVARPADAVALRSRPAEHRPDERAGVGVGGDAQIRVGVALKRVLRLIFSALTRPRDIELLNARSDCPHLPGDAVERTLRPKSCVEAVLPEIVRHRAEHRVAAAVAVVDENPAAGHIVLAVLFGDTLDDIGRRLGESSVGLLIRELGVLLASHVGVGVTKLKPPHRQHVGAPRRLGVPVENRRENDFSLGGAADEVERIEAILLVHQRRGLLVGEIVRARREGMSHHAEALRRHHERSGIGRAALGPVVVAVDQKLAPLVREVSDLLAAAVVAHILRRSEPLDAVRIGEIERRGFGEDELAALRDAHAFGLLVEIDSHLGRLERELAVPVGELDARSVLFVFGKENLDALRVAALVGKIELVRPVGSFAFPKLWRCLDAKDVRTIEPDHIFDIAVGLERKRLRNTMFRHESDELGAGERRQRGKNERDYKLFHVQYYTISSRIRKFWRNIMVV